MAETDGGIAASKSGEASQPRGTEGAFGIGKAAGAVAGQPCVVLHEDVEDPRHRPQLRQGDQVAPVG